MFNAIRGSPITTKEVQIPRNGVTVFEANWITLVVIAADKITNSSIPMTRPLVRGGFRIIEGGGEQEPLLSLPNLG
jgi:hypothetical protein